MRVVGSLGLVVEHGPETAQLPGNRSLPGLLLLLGRCAPDIGHIVRRAVGGAVRESRAGSVRSG